MSCKFWLTDEDSGIGSYKLARLNRRSLVPSLVRSVTATAAGPTSGIQITRTSGGTAIAWITEPLTGTNLTAAAWVAHTWAYESAAAANAALRFQILRYTNAEGATVLDDNGGTELGTVTTDYNRTTDAATLTALNAGDRIVFKVLIDDAGTLGANQTVTFSFNGENAGIEGDTYFLCPDNLTVLGNLPLQTEYAVRQWLRQARTSDDQPEPNLTRDEIIQGFGQALDVYSRHRPRLATASLSGDGSAYDFTLPRYWIHGLSQIREIQYPANQQSANIVDPNEYQVVTRPVGGQPVRALRFTSTTPSSGTDNISIAYTTLHSHTTEQDTIPISDYNAVCSLAASKVAYMFAAQKADSEDATIGADSVNHRDGESRWRSIARVLEGQYEDHIGLRRDASGNNYITEWDVNLSWGRDRLLHSRRTR